MSHPMRRRWLFYGLLGLAFGIADWYFLELLGWLGRDEAFNQWAMNAPAILRLVIVLLILAANYGIWLVPVVPAAAYEMQRSQSVLRAALAAVLVWSGALVSYYAYYAFMLMWVGLPSMDFMLFANRHSRGYWADWWPPFRRVIVDQFLEWIGIAVVGGAIVGSLAAISLRYFTQRSLRSGLNLSRPHRQF